MNTTHENTPISGLREITCKDGFRGADEFIDNLPDSLLGQLSFLSLHDSDATDSISHKLMHAKALKTLILTNTKCGDATTTSLKNMKMLRQLNLEGTAISDNGVECMQSLPELFALNIRNTRLSNNCLKHLPKGVSIEAKGTVISETQAHALLGDSINF